MKPFSKSLTPAHQPIASSAGKLCCEWTPRSSATPSSRSRSRLFTQSRSVDDSKLANAHSHPSEMHNARIDYVYGKFSIHFSTFSDKDCHFFAITYDRISGNRKTFQFEHGPGTLRRTSTSQQRSSLHEIPAYREEKKPSSILQKKVKKNYSAPSLHLSIFQTSDS